MELIQFIFPLFVSLACCLILFSFLFPDRQKMCVFLWMMLDDAYNNGNDCGSRDIKVFFSEENWWSWQWYWGSWWWCQDKECDWSLIPVVTSTAISNEHSQVRHNTVIKRWDEDVLQLMLLLNSCCSSTSKLKKNESLINNRTKGVGGGKRFLFFSSVFFYITTCFSFWCWKKMKKRENGKKSKSSWKSKEARNEMKRETARLQLEKEKSSTVKVFMKEVSFWLYFRGESGFFFKTSCCLWSEKVAFSLVQQLHAWIWKRFWDSQGIHGWFKIKSVL